MIKIELEALFNNSAPNNNTPVISHCTSKRIEPIRYGHGSATRRGCAHVRTSIHFVNMADPADVGVDVVKLANREVDMARRCGRGHGKVTYTVDTPHVVEKEELSEEAEKIKRRSVH